MTKKLADEDLNELSGGATGTATTDEVTRKDDTCVLEHGECGSPTGGGPGMVPDLQQNEP